ncbi:MAG: hypothetical protein R3F59_29175 [Myxococcota bacterium]
MAVRGGVWVLLGAALTGCDAGGYGGYGDWSLDSGVADTAVDTSFGTVVTGTATTSTVTGSSTLMGTQVGSEGFWNCPVEAVTDLGAGQQVVPSLDDTPAALTAARVGAWTVTVSDDVTGASSGGTLQLVDDGVYLWVDVTDGGACVDHLAVAVHGTLTHDDGWAASMEGVLALRPGDGQMILGSTGDLTDIYATWGATPLDPALTSFRFDVTVADETAFAGAASYVDCGGVSCVGAAPLGTVTGTR